MRDFLKTYKSSFILLGCTILGAIVGLIWGPKATELKPIGDLFINLIMMIVVPLVFFSVASGVANVNSMQRFGKIMKNVVIVFTITTLVMAVVGILGSVILDPAKGIDIQSVKEMMVAPDQEKLASKGSLLTQIVNSVTVSNFGDLFSSSNLLQLVVVAVLVGSSVAVLGDKANTIKKILNEGTSVVLNVVGIIMKLGPIGLGCYTASIIGELGQEIIAGYIRVFGTYCLIAIIYFIVCYTLYAYVAGGKKGVKKFYENSISPIATALATSSSSACIPSNLEASKKIGVPDDIAETVIPLGINIHKDGSVLAVIVKVAFLTGIMGGNMANPETLINLLVTVMVVGVFMAPVAGG